MPVSSKQHTAQPKWHAQPPDSHGFECHGILLRKSPSWSPHFQSLFQTMASLILLKLCFLLVSLTQKPLMHSQFLENKVKITSLVFCVLHGLNFLQPLSSFHLTVFLLEHSSLIKQGYLAFTKDSICKSFFLFSTGCVGLYPFKTQSNFSLLMFKTSYSHFP